MSVDFGAFATAVPAIVAGASSASDAWMAVLRTLETNATLAPDLATWDISRDVDAVTEQFRGILTTSPPRAALHLLYFGLFTAADPVTFEEQAGYYVVGSTREFPSVEVSAELAHDVIDYAPEERYLDSPLLHRVKALALAAGAQYQVYDYALMLAAAAVISFFAVRRAEMHCQVVVGFDSGDAISLRA